MNEIIDNHYQVIKLVTRIFIASYQHCQVTKEMYPMDLRLVSTNLVEPRKPEVFIPRLVYPFLMPLKQQLKHRHRVKITQYIGS